jgi:transcriptional regulator with XRE-family HTH domain
MMKITLKACRVNVGMTLKQASQHFGIHYETLSNYENDSTNVPRTFLIKIESVYGIPVENIFFGKQEDFIATMQENLKVVLP